MQQPQTVSREELYGILVAAMFGGTEPRAEILMETVPKMRVKAPETKVPNPFLRGTAKDRETLIRKVSRVEGTLTRPDTYSEREEDRRMRDGESGDQAFQAGSQSGATREGVPAPFSKATRGGTLFLCYLPQATRSVQYRTTEGATVDRAEVEPFLTPRKPSGRVPFNRVTWGNVREVILYPRSNKAVTYIIS